MIEIKNPVLKKIWEDRYRKNGESLEDNFRRVAKFVAQNKEEEKDFFKVMSEGLFFPAGRTMSNAGIGSKLGLNNCFVYPTIQDDMGAIFEAVKAGALTHKSGGGIGYEFSLIRPSGTPTSNDAIASGVVSFMDVFNAQTATVMQGSRRGANMGVLSIYHPDIEDFIYAKSKEANRLNHFNLSVMVDDDFMRAVENNSNITLHYPVYDEKYHIIKDRNKWKYEKEVSARELWDKIMKLAYVNGEPGIMFYDNMNKMNNTWYTETITHTNPCFTGDMKLLTEDGYKTFESLVNSHPVIKNYNGKSVVSHVWCSGEKEVIQLTLSNNKKIKCTPNHVFMTIDGEEVNAENLKNKRIKQYIDREKTHIKEFVRLGFLQGDGNLGRLKSKTHAGIEVNIGKNDIEIWDLFNIQNNNTNKYYLTGYKDQLISYGFNPNPLPSRTFPSTYDFWDPNEKLSFLRGCYSANGSVITTSRVAYKTTCKEFAMKLMDTLIDFGYSPYITTNKPKTIQFANGEYICKQSYDVNIGRLNDIIKFYEDIGFEQQYKMNSLLNLINKRSPKVIGIKSLGIQKVYDFTEPETHWGVVEGCIAHNCSEYIAGTVFNQELPSDQYAGACNLGSLMLHNFVERPFTDTAYFDFSKLSQTIKVAVRMLDNIIDINTFPLPQYENYQKNFRTIGLGVTGLADMLVMLGYKYNSKEAVDFVDTLMEFIAIAAYNNSINLAIEKGPFPFCEPESFIQSGFINAHKNGINGTPWYEISDRIERYGIRNARILSVAPCGTMSLTFGNNCSSGIEPIFSLGYDRKVKIGGQNEENEKIIHINDYAYENCPNKEEAPFVTAQEMTVQEHINMLAVIAKHIDMSVSKTINVPTDYSFEDTKNIYFDCWKKGIKGCTIFRPNEIRQGILLTETPKKEEEVKEERKLERGEIKVISDDVIGKKRRLISGCGSLHCAAYFDRTTGELLEVFLDKGSTGGCDNFMTGLSRMISLAARAGCSVYDIVDQLNSSGTCPSYAVRRATKHDTSPGSSCPVAVGNALLDMQIEINEELEIDNPKPIVKKKETKSVILPKYKCPECGSEITFEGGCQTCKNCGWSKCS